MEIHVEFLKFEFFLKLLDFDADFVSGDLWICQRKDQHESS